MLAPIIGDIGEFAWIGYSFRVGKSEASFWIQSIEYISSVCTAECANLYPSHVCAKQAVFFSIALKGKKSQELPF